MLSCHVDEVFVKVSRLSFGEFLSLECLELVMSKCLKFPLRHLHLHDLPFLKITKKPVEKIPSLAFVEV